MTTKSKSSEILYIKKYVSLSFKNSTEINESYRSLQIDYPKFFKMDNLSKLGFLASEMLLKDDENRFTPTENLAVICFNSSSSLHTDAQFQDTIQNDDNYFPSPSLFVYTLPNIVAGEIAIRNKFFGETSFYICEKFDAKQIARTVRNAFCDANTTAVMVAWIEYLDVFMALFERKKSDFEFSENQLKKIFNNDRTNVIICKH